MLHPAEDGSSASVVFFGGADPTKTFDDVTVLDLGKPSASLMSAGKRTRSGCTRLIRPLPFSKPRCNGHTHSLLDRRLPAATIMLLPERTAACTFSAALTRTGCLEITTFWI